MDLELKRVEMILVYLVDLELEIEREIIEIVCLVDLEIEKGLK